MDDRLPEVSPRLRRHLGENWICLYDSASFHPKVYIEKGVFLGTRQFVDPVGIRHGEVVVENRHPLFDWDRGLSWIVVELGDLGNR